TASAAECPVRGHAGVVERDVAEERVAVAVDGNRHVTGDAVVGRYRPLRGLPFGTRVRRPRGTRLVLIDADGASIVARVDRNARLREWPGLGDGCDPRTRRERERLPHKTLRSGARRHEPAQETGKEGEAAKAGCHCRGATGGSNVATISRQFANRAIPQWTHALTTQACWIPTDSATRSCAAQRAFGASGPAPAFVSTVIR